MQTNHHHYSMLFERFALLGHPLPQEVKDEITASTYLETYRKDEIILPYKEVCRNVYFVTEGLTMIKWASTCRPGSGIPDDVSEHPRRSVTVYFLRWQILNSTAI